MGARWCCRTAELAEEPRVLTTRRKAPLPPGPLRASRPAPARPAAPPPPPGLAPPPPGGTGAAPPPPGLAPPPTEGWLWGANRGADFTLRGQECLGKVVDVYDGDTLRLVFQPHPFSAPVQMAARMEGYDSAELRQPVGDPDRERKRALALAARDRLRELVLGRVVHVRCGDFDKYGRPLVNLRTLGNPRGDPPLDVNALMLAERHGLPYAGKRKPVH